ncbi:MAG: HU family DNA-binding protein [Mycoplasmataceae bacterium]|jgi:DNA-binding protein HU-beta|nr:HU family DNA-binding protein [Mycoplasmataceae bacterium]
MPKTLTKNQIIDKLADSNKDLKKIQIIKLLEDFNSLAIKEVRNNGAFKMLDIGKLKLVQTKARMGRNPKTGKEIKIPAKRVVKFSVTKGIKGIANN